MSIKLSLLFIALPVLVTAISVKAHDPTEHMASDEEPDCASLHQTESDKMDMKDPVAQAMMKQCMKNAMHGDNSAASASLDPMASVVPGSNQGKHPHDEETE